MAAAQSPEVICAGMMVVDVLIAGFTGLPAIGSTGIVQSIGLATGGDAQNAATVLAKLGVPVALWGMVGGDQQGAYIIGEARRLGIDPGGIAVEPGLPTTTSIVLIDGSGERSFLTSRTGSMRQLGPEHFDLARIKPGLKIFSVGSLFCAPRFDREALPLLLERAKSVGAITLADLVVDAPAGGLADIAHVLPLLDYIVPSEQEAAHYTGHADPQTAARALIGMGVGSAIIKLGAYGSMLCTPERTLVVPAFKVAKVVDTTGAGDNFMAGLIFGLSKGWPIEKCMRMGAAVAAISVQAIGANTGVRSLAQVEDFLASQETAI